MTCIPDVASVAGAITPVPGGVGPLTIAMLMSNTIKAARLRRGVPRCRKRSGRRGRATLMLRVGLTGGIASGKSTVAAMLRDLDCPVLDADTLGHELLEQGQDAYNEVVREFGKEILDAYGNVDRSKLGHDYFCRCAEARALESDSASADSGRGAQVVCGAGPDRAGRNSRSWKRR